MVTRAWKHEWMDRRSSLIWVSTVCKKTNKQKKISHQQINIYSIVKHLARLHQYDSLMVISTPVHLYIHGTSVTKGINKEHYDLGKVL